jgi:translocation and assembly module TamA
MSADLGIRTGDPARAADVLAAGDHLLATLRQAGYALATVAPPVATLYPDQGMLDVAFAVNAGPRVDLGPITISGLQNVHAAYVRNRLTLHPGQTFNPTEIEAARADLAGLGVFSDVRVQPATQLDAEGRLPLTFVVTEAPPRSVDLGLSYATDTGVSPSVGWHHHNLFGNGEQLNLTASASNGGDADTGLGYKVGAQFIKPDFWARDQTLQVEVDALRQDLQAYDQDALIESVTLTRPLWPHWTGSVGLSAEQEYILQEDVGRSYNLVDLPMTLKYDSSNSVLEPTKGIRAALAVTPTQSLSGGDATFLTVQASASTYFDVTGNGRSVVAVRGLLGQIAGAGQFSLPPDQRFYAGGSTTVRGFRYQSVGPQFADGKPTGGTAIVAGTVELRQRLFGNWGAAAFVDAGQVTASGAPLAGTWRMGAGVGARYYTSIGPIRLDIAVPVNRGPGGDAFELYIGLGEAF